MRTAVPLLELTQVRREFPAGEEVVRALDEIDLKIFAGEMVAIVGTSGSGKSTLMNVLGCLDRPSLGTYRIAGIDTAGLNADALSTLRCERFGFVFQRYHLLADLSALANVEAPAIYAGLGRPERRSRAALLLARVGLQERMHCRPNQLSGGEQQRVGIARALMNGGEVILADEPTGALDKHSGQEMLKILKGLHAAGHTIITVTHDMQVAEHAARIIEISDGRIISDRCIESGTIDHERRVSAARESTAARSSVSQTPWRADWNRFHEGLRTALIALGAHRLRTSLTILGIIIGIASVVSAVALGEGSQRRVLEDIKSLGTNTIDIYPGRDFGDTHALSIRTLVPADADTLEKQPYVDSVTPMVSTLASLRNGDVSLDAMVQGVGEQFFRVHGNEVAHGVFFGRSSVRRQAQEMIIDDRARKKLFVHGENPLGKVILVGNLPCRIIGVASAKSSFGNGESLTVWLPYTTVMVRISGQPYLRSMTVRVVDSVSPLAAQQSILNVLKARHGTQDFYAFNTDVIRQTVQRATATLTLLISAIALISLIVGGIGVMNIMLVSVAQRTREIGVRMAVGARQGDIIKQFLIEAVLMCLVGGALGIGLALCIGVLLAYFSNNLRMTFSPSAMIVAFVCSTLIGIVFGYLPAHNAARLDPVDSLARD